MGALEQRATYSSQDDWDPDSVDFFLIAVSLRGYSTYAWTSRLAHGLNLNSLSKSSTS